MNSAPYLYYENKAVQLKFLIEQYTNKSKSISRMRLALFLISILLLWNTSSYTYLFLFILIVSVALFSFLIRYTNSTDKLCELYTNLYGLVQEEIKSLNHVFVHKPDGEKFISTMQVDSNDLDLFGKGSLYQYMNRSISDIGNYYMADSLLKFDEKLIAEKQIAIKELSAKIDWILTFRALQVRTPITDKSKNFLNAWILNKEAESIPQYYNLLSIIGPIISLTLVLLYAFKYIEIQTFSTWVIVVLGVQGFFAAKAAKIFKPLHPIHQELASLSPCLESIEKEEFVSSLLNDQKNYIIHPQLASKSIQSLHEIINRYDYRMNILVFIPLNFFTWWDIRQLLALKKWKSTLNTNISRWYETLGKYELYTSYATLSYNKPEWIYPAINNHWFTFHAEKLGHPLIDTKKLVSNDFTLTDPNELALITGSNMAGKSTFLRSIGANLILANAGAPVCASAFTWSPCNLLTSMRISDNLQEETSTFYAELKKVKKMVDAINNKEKVILLIDEMLRGTNTEDRKKGVNGFIRKLINTDAVAIIASHDTGIYSFEKEYPQKVKSYYFDSFIEDDALKFDYKIKEGTVSSTNASFLIKKVGIDI